MIIGVGVDLCAIARMEKAIKKEHFTSRVFTAGERAYMDARGALRAHSAAAMFAAKEAAAKALKTGFSGGVMPAQIEVAHEESGAPSLVFHGAALERFKEIGGTRAHLSLSHEGDMAIAYAMIEGEPLRG